jgi:hypothetical protein
LQILPVIALTTSNCKGAILKGINWNKRTGVIITVKKYKMKLLYNTMSYAAYYLKVCHGSLMMTLVGVQNM